MKFLILIKSKKDKERGNYILKEKLQDKDKGNYTLKKIIG